MAEGGSPMSGRSARWTVPIVVVAMALVAACTSSGGSGSTPRGPDEPGTSPSGSIPDVTSSPAGAATRSPAASLIAEPPAASLKAEGGDPVGGQLGSYTWDGSGSDSPWLQGSPIRVGAREPLTVTIAGDPAVGDWTVQRVEGGTTGGTGAIAMGSGQDVPIRFVAPAAGSW